ncbi:MAG: JAB domain-containing protein [Ruminococcus sp.]|nr:JAB domain-containing protein [Ruminococcus sp.]MBR6385185.1 JAB domain-containing protein [Ruminococcus sp.]
MDENEILKQLICFSEKENNAEEISRKLLETYGSISSILDSDKALYMKSMKMREQTAVLISVVAAINRRCEIEKVKGNYINNTEIAKKYFEAYLKGYSNEVIAAVILNSRFYKLNDRFISFGSAGSVSSMCRKFAEAAVFNDNARYMIISHNHPSGNTEPSQEDIFSTECLVEAMNLVNVTVLDHIIVGRNSSLSMKEKFGDEIFENTKGYKIK